MLMNRGALCGQTVTPGKSQTTKCLACHMDRSPGQGDRKEEERGKTKENNVENNVEIRLQSDRVLGCLELASRM